MQPARTTTIAEQQQLLSTDGLLILRELVSATRANQSLTKPSGFDEDRWGGTIMEIEDAGFELDYRGNGAYRIRLIENEAAMATRFTPLELSIDKLETRLDEMGGVDVRETEWAYATGRALEQAMLTIRHLKGEVDQLHRDLAHNRLELAEHRANPTIGQNNIYEVQRDNDTYYIVKNGQTVGHSEDPQAAAEYVASKHPSRPRAWAAGVQQYDERETLSWSSTEIIYAVDEQDAWRQINAEYPIESGYVIQGVREQEHHTPTPTAENQKLTPAETTAKQSTGADTAAGAQW